MAEPNSIASPQRDLPALLMVAGAAASWGLWSLFLRPTGLPPPTISLVVFAIMGFAALAAVPFDRGVAPRWDRVTVALLAGNTVCDAVNVVTFFAAMQRTTVAVAVLTHYLAPILVALAAPYIERIRVRGAVLAAAVATAGLTLILAPWRPEQRTGDVAVGAALGAVSALAYAGNVFIVRRLGPRIGGTRTMAYHSLAAAVLLLPLGAGGLGAVGGDDLALLSAGALTIGVISGYAYVTGLPRVGSARASVLTFFEPAVAVVVGWVAWGEPLGAAALAGAALIVAAGVWVARGTAAPAPATAPPR